MDLKKNIFWNTFGTIEYLGAQWLTTILVVSLSGDYAEAGLYSLAMSITNIFYNIANYSVRNFQVSDIKGQFKNEDYLAHRVIAMILAFTACILFMLIFYRDLYKIGVVTVYMLFRMGEAFVDVFHGVDQKHDRMDIVGKSHMIRGILLLAAFTVFEYLFKNIFVSICAMTICTIAAIIFYDIRMTKIVDTIKWSVDISQVKKIFIICFPLLVYGLALNGLASIPRIITEDICGSEMLGYYASVATLAVIVQSLTNVIFTPFITTFTKYYEEGNKEAFVKLTIKMILFCTVLGLIAYFGSYFLSEWVLDGILFRGKGIGPYCYLLKSTMICSTLVSIIWLIAILLTIDRATIILSVSTIIGALLEFFLSYYLIKANGIDGINRSLILSYICVTILMGIGTIIRLKKHFKEYKI